MTNDRYAFIEKTFGIDTNNQIINDEAFCKHIIEDFIQTPIDDFKVNYYGEKVNNFNEIKNFFFGNLYLHPKFGTLKGYQDCDNSELYKAIAFLYYKIKLNNKDISLKINIEENCYTTIILNGVNLRGDTLNTFNTLFGGGRDDYVLCCRSLDKQIIENKDYKMVRPQFIDTDIFDSCLYCFHKTYQMIGNFMLLPNNKSIRNGHESHTMNCYRGLDERRNGAGWGDYYDRFLLALKKSYGEILQKDFDAKELPAIKSANDEYFKLFPEFKDFINFNYLNSYVDSEYNVKELFQPYDILYKNSTPKPITLEETKQRYQNFAKNFIKISTGIIKDRSNHIIDTVNERYFEKTNG